MTAARLARPLLAALLLLLAGPGARADEVKAPAPARPAPGAVLAKGRGVEITAEAFEAIWREHCLDPKRKGPPPPACRPEGRAEMLGNLVRFRVLALEARRRGLDQDPEVQGALEKLMVQRLVKLEFADDGPQGAATREEKLAAFERLVERLRQETRVRVDEAALQALDLPAP